MSTRRVTSRGMRAQVYQVIRTSTASLDNVVEFYAAVNLPSLPGGPKSEPVVTTLTLRHGLEVLAGSTVRITFEDTEVKATGALPSRHCCVPFLGLKLGLGISWRSWPAAPCASPSRTPRSRRPVRCPAAHCLIPPSLPRLRLRVYGGLGGRHRAHRLWGHQGQGDRCAAQPPTASFPSPFLDFRFRVMEVLAGATVRITVKDRKIFVRATSARCS